MPYVKIPTNTGNVGNDSVEGGLIFPWAMKLTGGVQTGAMLQWERLRNAEDNGYDLCWCTSAYAHRNFTRFLGFYAEATAVVSSASASSFAGSLGGGVTLERFK